MCVGGDAEPAQVHPALSQAVDLLAQDAQVHYHAVADHAQLAGVEDPGGDQMELVHLVAQHDRVAGVVSALKADHGVRLLGKEVHDLALALIAPLGADYYESRHDRTSLGERALSPRKSAGGLGP